MTKMSMLEYSKLILEKVSFDTSLFVKEFKKAVNHLLEHEVRELENWVKSHYRQYLELVPVPVPVPVKNLNS